VGSLTREVALERELTDATEKLSKMKAEKEQLEASVQVYLLRVSQNVYISGVLRNLYDGTLPFLTLT
jgi:hypothetical protein